ncbi:MAG TPA: kynureninase [Acidimicrobiales bacterium]|nr:kynureninase [Acidimicrobiales bacterium]
MNRSAAEDMDRRDPLAPMRDRFAIDADGPIYMDGNSLGRPPKAVLEAVTGGLADWAGRLVGGWEDWIDLPAAVGDRLGRLLGAGPGQVLVCDSTTVNIYKLASAALAARPGRPVIVGDAADFPTDRYVLEGLAASTGRRLHLLGPGTDDETGAGAEAICAAIDDRCALVCLSHVNYRSGARLDVAAITERAHAHGALVLWDLAHSAGSVPVELDRWGVDLAAGCTYKYLNSGPGAPGFLYVRRDLQADLRQPIWGWFGRARQFEMAAGYEPAAGPASFLTGTPGVLGLLAVDASLQVMEDAGIDALWAKSQQMTRLLVDLADDRLAPLGGRVVTPRDPDRRGAHVSVAHPRAWAWCRTLIDRHLVVPDFRTPDVVRLGPAPIYTRYVDCYDAVELMAGLLAGGLDPVTGSRRVT